MFVIAGGAAPALILGNIVQKLYDEPKLVLKYKENPRKFILEMSRLERGVPLVNFMAYNYKSSEGKDFVTIFDKKVPVPNGTPLHCSIQNANRDGT